jgi:hypothetical protein
MSAPIVVSVDPADGASGLVSGLKITVTFDQLIDPTTFSTQTFLLRGPGDAILITPDQLSTDTPNLTPGSEAIAGEFSYGTTADGTAAVVEFDPGIPLVPNTTYTCMIVGASSLVSQDAVRNLNGEPMAVNYQWSFTTGYLDTDTPPPQSPLPVLASTLDPTSVVIRPAVMTDGGTTQTITMTFPGDIDADAFAGIKDSFLISISPVLSDPLLPDLSGATSTVSIDGPTLTITITFPN